MENRIVKLKKESIIYVVSPAYFKTGGTELLHQLVFNLVSFGFNAKIVYPDGIDSKGINPAFFQYIDSFIKLEEIEDDEKNFIIFPEVYTNLTRKFKRIKKSIWWLSVDNYLKSFVSYYIVNREYKKAIKLFAKKILCFNRNSALSLRKLKDIPYHFVQSEFARIFLLEHKIKNTIYLSDYINDLYIKESKNVDISAKENLVCYNPKKGYKFTKKIIESSKNIEFVPLINMSNEEVIGTLKKAKVYIDFGNHPGKDRFPREAASLKCCIITGRRGAANNPVDIKINDKYKFYDKKENIRQIIDRINYSLNNYEDCINEFNSYVQSIFEEKQGFIDEIKNIFIFE
jgi:hypothetical protein